MTGRDLISASLRLIGATAPGESLDAREATDGLASLNRMIASWSTESMLINARVREAFPLVAGQQIYTMGVGGNFNTTRPVSIESAGLLFSGTSPSTEIPVLVLNQEQWAAISVKGVTSTIPLYVYPEGTSPLETLNVWPVPTANHSLVLYSQKALSSVTTLDTTVDFPPGYEEALIYNLAIRLAPEYGKGASPEIQQIASDSKSTIKRMNYRPQYLQVDDALRANPRTFNWITGDSS